MSGLSSLPPFVVFLAAGLLAAVTRGVLRSAIMLAAPFVAAWLLWNTTPGLHLETSLFGLPLALYEVDSLSMLFGWLFCLGSLIAILYALHVRDTLQHVAAMLYAGSALGAVFAGDLITLFLFWEGLALSSVFLIWARRTPAANAAGIRYLLLQVLSGMLLLVGIVIHIVETGQADFTALRLDAAGAWFIFIGLGLKAGFPVLHTWLTDAYPEATETGTVFLCMFTTKVAVYTLARGFPGAEPLVYIGVAMTFFPIFFAVIENDLRRVLSYSMINQLGFMVCGIGLGSSLAMNGAVAHAFNDVLFKGLLFMAMGAVMYVTGRTRASDLGGLYKKMPVTTVLCIIGALSISAVPLFSAFVSKSMIMTAALEQERTVVWLFLLFASVGVLEHAGIKIPFFAFFAHDQGIDAREPPLNMRLAMTVSAVLCVAIGCYPAMLYQLLPYPVDYSPYDLTHVIVQLQLLTFGALAVFWMMRTGAYPAEVRAINLDADWLWRRLIPSVVGAIINGLQPVFRGGRAFASRQMSRADDFLRRHHGASGTLARTWPTGSMVLWVALLLAVFIVAYYI
ncbi:MAG: Na(+)/H(+) antiporter subunit D [Gammaproteobacteria bacterium]